MRAVFDEVRLVVQEAFRIFSIRGGRVLSGALAFSAILSVVPLLVLALKVAALITGEAAARRTLYSHLAHWVGDVGAQNIAEWLGRTSSRDTEASVLGFVILVYGSTRLFSTLNRAFDLLWSIDPMANSTFRDRAKIFLVRRLFSFLLVVFVGIMLVCLVFGHTVLETLREYEAAFGVTPMHRWLEYAVSFVATSLLFAVMFRVVPSTRIQVRVAAVGGVVTAVLFTFGAALVGGYIAHKAVESVFGAATSVVLLLLWTYYSAHVFFFGAALTHVLELRWSRALAVPTQSEVMSNSP